MLFFPQQIILLRDTASASRVTNLYFGFATAVKRYIFNQQNNSTIKINKVNHKFTVYAQKSCISYSFTKLTFSFLCTMT